MRRIRGLVRAEAEEENQNQIRALGSGLSGIGSHWQLLSKGAQIRVLKRWLDCRSRERPEAEPS